MVARQASDANRDSGSFAFLKEGVKLNTVNISTSNYDSLGFKNLGFGVLFALCGLAHAEQNPTAVAASVGPDATKEWLVDPKTTPFYLVMDKQSNALTARTYSPVSKVIRKFRAITGSSLGDKLREGDKRTPEGIYFVETEVPQSRLTKLHGAAGFELNYPNSIDRIFKRTGSGIWIHGVDSETRLEKRFDTLGCVALGNKEVVELGRYLRLRQTPIVVVSDESKEPYIGYESPESPLGKRIMEWAAAWASPDVEKYLSFYHKDFYSEGRDFESFKAHKRFLAKSYKNIQVQIKNLKILRHGKYSVVVFAQNYTSNRYQWIGYKRLYLIQDGPEHNYYVLAENGLQGHGGPIGTLGIDFASFAEEVPIPDRIVEEHRPLSFNLSL